MIDSIQNTCSNEEGKGDLPVKHDDFVGRLYGIQATDDLIQMMISFLHCVISSRKCD